MAKKVKCIHEEATKFAIMLENILNASDPEPEYYNIIPVGTNTAGEFKAIVILEYPDEDDFEVIEDENPEEDVTDDVTDDDVTDDDIEEPINPS